MRSGSVVLSRSQVRAYDAWCMREVGIPGLLLMECAAIGVAHEAMRAWTGGPGADPLFAAVCGPGQNGGDGYAAIRHIHSSGGEAIALEADAPRPGTDAALQHRLAGRLGLVEPFACAASRVERAAATRRIVVLDALYGTGLDRPLAGLDAVRVRWIALMRERGAKVLSVDIPSGMDCDSGAALGGICVEADITVTMVAPKVGMVKPEAARRVGRVVAVPIGGPPLAQFLAPGTDSATARHAGEMAADAHPTPRA